MVVVPHSPDQFGRDLAEPADEPEAEVPPEERPDEKEPKDPSKEDREKKKRKKKKKGGDCEVAGCRKGTA